MPFAKRIETGRLVLRPIGTGDLGFFVRLHRNRDVRRYLGGPVRWRDLPQRFRRDLAGAPDTGTWLVCPARRHRAIGLVVLGPHKDGRDYEVSYQFHPRSWGQGIASEAVDAVIRHGLAQAGLAGVIAETQCANAASRRLLDRAGMVEIERIERFGAAQIIFATGARRPETGFAHKNEGSAIIK